MVVMTSGNYFSGLYQDNGMDSIRNSSLTGTVTRTKKMMKQKIKYTFQERDTLSHTCLLPCVVKFPSSALLRSVTCVVLFWLHYLSVHSLTIMEKTHLKSCHICTGNLLSGSQNWYSPLMQNILVTVSQSLFSRVCFFFTTCK